MRIPLLVLVSLFVLCVPAVAEAYPQFQLSKGQTCTACHYAPAGGGLLNGVGLFIAEDLSGKGDPALLYGAIKPPPWLTLGGDVRFGAGLNGRSDYGPSIEPGAFPMQGDLYARAHKNHLSANLTFGLRGGVGGGKFLSFLQAREHYVMWTHHKKGGIYARVGRFMAPYGLRLAEHPAYTRRYSGTNLFSETYGLSAGYISNSFEIHATGFVHDFWRDPVEAGDGGAFYAEKRIARNTSLGISARYADSPDEARTQGGVTGKHWFASLNTLVQAQVDGIHQTIDTGPSRDQLVAYVLSTYFWKPAWHYELGLGHYDEDLSVKNLDRDAIDINVRYIYDSHLEFELNTRVQTIGLGSGGATSGFAIVQVHARL